MELDLITTGLNGFQSLMKATEGQYYWNAACQFVSPARKFTSKTFGSEEMPYASWPHSYNLDKVDDVPWISSVNMEYEVPKEPCLESRPVSLASEGSPQQTEMQVLFPDANRQNCRRLRKRAFSSQLQPATLFVFPIRSAESEPSTMAKQGGHSPRSHSDRHSCLSTESSTESPNNWRSYADALLQQITSQYSVFQSPDEDTFTGSSFETPQRRATINLPVSRTLCSPLRPMRRRRKSLGCQHKCDTQDSAENSVLGSKRGACILATCQSAQGSTSRTQLRRLRKRGLHFSAGDSTVAQNSNHSDGDEAVAQASQNSYLSAARRAEALILRRRRQRVRRLQWRAQQMTRGATDTQALLSPSDSPSLSSSSQSLQPHVQQTTEEAGIAPTIEPLLNCWDNYQAPFYSSSSDTESGEPMNTFLEEFPWDDIGSHDLSDAEKTTTTPVRWPQSPEQSGPMDPTLVPPGHVNYRVCVEEHSLPSLIPNSNSQKPQATSGYETGPDSPIPRNPLLSSLLKKSKSQDFSLLEGLSGPEDLDKLLWGSEATLNELRKQLNMLWDQNTVSGHHLTNRQRDCRYSAIDDAIKLAQANLHLLAQLTSVKSSLGVSVGEVSKRLTAEADRLSDEWRAMLAELLSAAQADGVSELKQQLHELQIRVEELAQVTCAMTHLMMSEASEGLRQPLRQHTSNTSSSRDNLEHKLKRCLFEADELGHQLTSLLHRYQGGKDAHHQPSKEARDNQPLGQEIEVLLEEVKANRNKLRHLHEKMTTETVSSLDKPLLTSTPLPHRQFHQLLSSDDEEGDGAQLVDAYSDGPSMCSPRGLLLAIGGFAALLCCCLYLMTRFGPCGVHRLGWRSTLAVLQRALGLQSGEGCPLEREEVSAFFNYMNGFVPY